MYCVMSLVFYSHGNTLVLVKYLDFDIFCINYTYFYIFINLLLLRNSL
jgi:hypothetical protein